MRLVLLTAATALLFMMMSGAALAAYPHGDFAASSDVCAGCHRVHTATANNLLKDPSGSCRSCHADGLGADTDVENGIYIADSVEDKTAPGHVWGANGETLLGGGFNYVGGAVAGAVTTSVHKVDVGNQTPPGKDAAAGAIINFTCTSCHSTHPDNSHPNQYRLLRSNVNGQTVPVAVGWNGPWTDASQTTQGGDYRAYTDTDFVSGTPGVQYYTKNYQKEISNWCAACHPHYLATEAGGSYNAYKVEAGYDAGDTYGAAERHRHTVNVAIKGRTVGDYTYNLVTDMPLADVTVTTTAREDADLLVCLSCHRAHGSAAVMHGNAVLEPGFGLAERHGQHAAPDGRPVDVCPVP